MSAVRASNFPARACVALSDSAMGAHRGSMSMLTTRSIAKRGRAAGTAPSAPTQPPRISTLPRPRPDGREQRIGEPALARHLVLVERDADVRAPGAA